MTSFKKDGIHAKASQAAVNKKPRMCGALFLGVISSKEWRACASFFCFFEFARA